MAHETRIEREKRGGRMFHRWACSCGEAGDWRTRRKYDRQTSRQRAADGASYHEQANAAYSAGEILAMGDGLNAGMGWAAAQARADELNAALGRS